jgi:acetyl-CoA synthetase
MLDQYASLSESFHWHVPTNFNIGEECCHRWAKSSADARRIALFFEDAAGHRDIWTYERLGAATNQFANALTRMGIKPGDRVATILGQSAEAVIAQLAAFSVGAVAVPLGTQLAPKALEYRLRDAETRIAIVGAEGASSLLSILSRCAKLTQVIGVGIEDSRVLPWRSLMIRQPEQFKAVTTRADDPALLLYSPDTGQPARGVLLPHRCLIGALPGFVASQNWFPKGAEVFWTALDWANASGLLCGLLPTLYFGRAIVGVRGATTPGQAQQLLERYRVTHALAPGSVLRQLKLSMPPHATQPSSHLRSMTILDEGVDEGLAQWCKAHFGLSPNHLFSTAEIQAVIGESQLKWSGKIGSLGRAYPGHRIAILNEDGSEAHSEQIGEISIHRNDRHGVEDPVLPLRYWRTMDATENNPDLNGWWRTGALGRIDADGFFWYAGRKNRLPTKNKTTLPATGTVSAGTDASMTTIVPVANITPAVTLATVKPTE